MSNALSTERPSKSQHPEHKEVNCKKINNKQPTTPCPKDPNVPDPLHPKHSMTQKVKAQRYFKQFYTGR